MKVLHILIVIFAVLGYKYCASNAQGLQQLSYANADIGEKLIRSTIPTTASPITTTTQKSGLFSGLRNLFSRSTTSTTTTTTTTTTTASPRILTNGPPSNVHHPSIAHPTQPVAVGHSVQQNTHTTNAPIRSTNTPTTPNIPSITTPKPIISINPISSTTQTSRPTIPTIPTIRPTQNSLPLSSSTVRPAPTTNPPTIPTTATSSNKNTPLNIDNINNFPPLPTRKSSIGTPTGNSLNPSSTDPSIPGRHPATRPTTHTPWGGALPPAATDANGITDAEIMDLTEELFRKEKEDNLFDKITVNYQGRTYSSSTTDEAPEPLLTLNQTILDTVPTIMKMRLLYNNYELDAAVNEHVTPMEKNEETDLTDALLATPLMRKAMLFLQEKGKVTPDVKTHKDLLKTIWFKLYSRGNGKIGSSGFEHVFVAELKKGEISGLHNWVYFYEEESLGRINYMGYMKKLELGDKGALVKLRFTYDGHVKHSNTLFIGTSPELEIALYTICFQLRPDTACPISLNGKQFTIRTYTFRYRGTNLIGSAFAEI